MSLTRILGLGTYPIKRPLHGGQRRVAAFKRFYENRGITYTYACIYDGGPYGPSDVGPDDTTLIVPSSELGLVSIIGDVMSGRQAVMDAATLRHFVGIAERIAPDALQLEQPFMWPLAKRLRQALDGRKPLLVYSSQNVEAPLKRAILKANGVPSELQRKICTEIEELEAELTREADFIVCVSAADREHYCKLKSPSKVIVVPNGVDRPPMRSMHRTIDALHAFGGQPYLMTVGSGYSPNIEGICHYVVRGGVFCVPPAKSIAICGGVAGPLFSHPEYQRYLTANSNRVQFFPDIADSELWAIKQCCHGVMLPIRSGGGSNLKTAEALALGKWTIATQMALRGFEAFSSADGVIIAGDPTGFRHAMREVLKRPPLRISESERIAREALFWDHCFADSGVSQALEL